MERYQKLLVRWIVGFAMSLIVFTLSHTEVCAEEAAVEVEESLEETSAKEEVSADNTEEAETKTEEINEEVSEEVPLSANAEEIQLLAALIQCEAGNQPYEGKVAVGEIVMNRVESGRYPNSIHDVIFASGQFPPATNGLVASKIAQGVSDTCMMAAQQAVAGSELVGEATHFRRAGNAEGVVIGSHVFW